MLNEFVNRQVDAEQLPQVLHLEKRPLSERYAPINRLINLIFTFIVLLFICALYFQPLLTLPTELKNTLPYIIWGLGAFGLIVTWYTYVSDKLKFYSLRELDLHYSSGLFFRKTVSQPITRIQHIELKRGPIERRIDLATLQVFSAGGSMHTFEIPGLPVNTAEQLRQFILEHKDVAKHG